MDGGQLTVGNAANWYIGKLLRYYMVLNVFHHRVVFISFRHKNKKTY